MVRYELDHVSPDMSFLEMLDVLNEQLTRKGEEPVAFDHDCREGICGIVRPDDQRRAARPAEAARRPASCTCAASGRRRDLDRAVARRGVPGAQGPVVDRGAFDRIIQAGAFISVNTGAPQDANAIPVPKADADKAFDAATCIGCGACVAACKNASAMLFVGAKVSHFVHLPQGPAMVEQMDHEAFGHCTNHFECGEACPKDISVEHIALLNADYAKGALWAARPKQLSGDG
jgi:succinate dehydrogenase / fumarate reductase iron-sulfur subunit